ncbi:MAG: Fic family protein [Candidatus Daviesbacteria bacterium]
MDIPPKYQITPQILELISKIDANLMYLSSMSLPASINNKIQRTSLLKSSLYSARIEGNTLTYEQIHREDDKTNEKKEIFNILKAVQFIESTNFSSKITSKTILMLHSLVLSGLSDDGGFFRTEPTAIFNTAGIAVYITPSPNKISELLKSMLHYSNSRNEKFPIINAFISHLIFEKIHPFLDGNGRVGRLLVFAILKSKQKSGPFFIPFEEYLDNKRQEYYYQLDNGLKNTNDYLIFMLGAFYEQTEKTKQIVVDEMGKEQYLLTPRQEEIYNIIKDHNIISFDEIKRRFLKLPARTLSYDLKKLINKKLVIKIGETKGTYYKIAS